MPHPPWLEVEGAEMTGEMEREREREREGEGGEERRRLQRERGRRGEKETIPQLGWDFDL